MKFKDWIRENLRGPPGPAGFTGPAGCNGKCECAEEVRSLRVRVSYLEGKLANWAFLETLIQQAKK
jgi:hypothetical protein